MRSPPIAQPDEIGDLLKLALPGDFEGAESLLGHLLHERGIAPNELIDQCLPGAREDAG